MQTARSPLLPLFTDFHLALFVLSSLSLSLSLSLDNDLSRKRVSPLSSNGSWTTRRPSTSSSLFLFLPLFFSFLLDLNRAGFRYSVVWLRIDIEDSSWNIQLLLSGDIFVVEIEKGLIERTTSVLFFLFLVPPSRYGR